MESKPGSGFLFEHDLFRPCFARRSGFAKAGNRYPLFGIMLWGDPRGRWARQFAEDFSPGYTPPGSSASEASSAVISRPHCLHAKVLASDNRIVLPQLGQPTS
jgi:hypothetical protein